jgi:dihydrofolate reductase
MQHFRALTMGKPVVMGRKTFESIGKPLKGRTNIIVSRDPDFAAPGIVVAPDIGVALAAAHGDALRRGADSVTVVGGQDIFAATMPQAARLEITIVHAKPEGDTFFPPIDTAIWQEVAREDHAASPGDDAAFTFVTYRRAQDLESQR